MPFTAKYGYVGLSVEQKEFVVEGLNEAGLSAGLFYFPGYGKYETIMPVIRTAPSPIPALYQWLLGQGCRDHWTR